METNHLPPRGLRQRPKRQGFLQYMRLLPGPFRLSVSVAYLWNKLSEETREAKKFAAVQKNAEE